MRKMLYILGELEDSDLQWLLDAGSPRPVTGGEQIIREGSHNDELFIVVDGDLAVTRAGQEIAHLGAGEVVGDMSLLDSRPPTATVEASQDSIVHAIPQARLRSKLRSDSEFAARFYRALCIFLANRLSQGGGPRTAADPGAEEEISPDVLEAVALAGARFDWFLQRVKSG